jgi:hypothetical protein
VNPAVARIRSIVKRLLADGQQEGIEVGGPLGRWLEGQAEALTGLADVLEEQASRIDDTLSRVEAAAGEQLRA